MIITVSRKMLRRASFLLAIAVSPAIGLSGCSQFNQSELPMAASNATGAIHLSLPSGLQRGDAAPNIFGNPARNWGISPAYPRPTVENRTEDKVTNGNVLFHHCKGDEFGNIAPGATWTGPPRGLCLIQIVTAFILTRDGYFFQAHEYHSFFGTSYSHFAVVQTGHRRFEVIRI